MKAPTPARWAESFHPEPPSAARLAHALAAIPAARRAMFHQQLHRMVISRLEGMDPDRCIDIAFALAESARDAAPTDPP